MALPRDKGYLDAMPKQQQPYVVASDIAEVAVSSLGPCVAIQMSLDAAWLAVNILSSLQVCSQLYQVRVRLPV